MKRFLQFAACMCLAGLMSGCACNDYSLAHPFKNKPIRSKLRSWCKGDACSTCNTPAGQMMNCDSNVAPLCDNCGTIGPAMQPAINAPVENGQVPSPAPATEETSFLNSTNSFNAGLVSDIVSPPDF
ncbi:hypothetical protein N9B31_02315 [Mariniblastus sp.]|nr:hypothetical protein [Mariniblastus sp.]